MIYTGKVVKVVDFGAFVNFFGAKDGLVHVSPDSPPPTRPEGLGRRQAKATEVKVKFLGFDDRGKIRSR
jgi:polyribonucleotide nucleotidyltransferase